MFTLLAPASFLLFQLSPAYATCEQEYELAGYNNGAAMYKYTGGCQQHFEYVLNQEDGLTFTECSAKCLEHKDWCRSFAFGKNDIEGKCNLYGGICTPIIDNNDHSNWDMFTPILSSSATWDFTGMCPQHFRYPLWQDKTGTLTVEECSQKCSVDGQQWCRSFAYGKSTENDAWCNLYGGVCKYDVLPTRESEWDFGVPIFNQDNVDVIPLYTGRCQEHFQFGLLQDKTGTYTFDMCKRWAVTNKNWCKSFTFGTSDENRNWCNLYSGICTPQNNDYLDNDVFQVRHGINNAKAICNSDINVTFSLNMIFIDDKNNKYENSNLTQSFVICDEYFGSQNDSLDSLSSVDAIFYYVMQLLSEINDIIVPPNTLLRDNLVTIDCKNKHENTIPIQTNVSVESMEKDIYKLFASDSKFINVSSKLLSELFGIPILLKDINNTTNQGIVSEVVVLIVICALLMIIGIILFIQYRRKMARKAKTMFIRNPLVVLIGIGFYDENTQKPEIDGYLRDLDDGISVDISTAIELFRNTFNYHIQPNYNDNVIEKLTWNRDKLVDFLTKMSETLDEIVYDSLIVLISCHGIDQHIITSDYKIMSKKDIHRIFSKSGQSRDIPRMFIFDCCSGNKERHTNTRQALEDNVDGEQHIDNKNELKVDDVEEQTKNVYAPEIDRTETVQWAFDENNPDFKLITINAANEGFQSKMRTDTGSYFIQSFIRKIKENDDISDGLCNIKHKLFLSDIIVDIQHDLEGTGKQLPEFKCNNGTDKIIFIKNKNELNILEQEHNDMEQIEMMRLNSKQEDIERNIDTDLNAEDGGLKTN